MKQSEDEHLVYAPLAIHITDEYFLNNQSRYVGIFCCGKIPRLCIIHILIEFCLAVSILKI